MPTITIDGCNVFYQESGSGTPIVLTAGGRAGLEATQPLAEKLSATCRVIQWDRANVGRSDVAFHGPSDLDLWADQLSELLRQIGATTVYLAGASAGSRISYHAARRHPQQVRGLFLWQVSAGPVAQVLGINYYGAYADVAEKDGMPGVMQTPFFAERIEMNPANRDLLLAIDPQDFVQVMRRWQGVFRPEDPVIGATEEELGQINVPAMVLAGCDDSHPRDRSLLLAKLLPDAEVVDPPGFAEEWVRVSALGPPGTMYAHMSPLPELIRGFIAKNRSPRPKLDRNLSAGG